MKTTIRSFSRAITARVVLFSLVLPLLSIGTNANANWGAFCYSTGEGSFGAVGISWNYRTASSATSSAITRARNAAGGSLNGYKCPYWSYKKWEAGARAFNSDVSSVRVGWAYGWSTSRSAVNTAVNKLAGLRNGLWYASGYVY